MSVDEGLQIGRRVKAKRIAAAIRSLDGTADDARRMTESDWLNADKLSVQQTGQGGPKPGVKWLPPSPETRALVIEILSREESPEFLACPPRDEDVPA